MLGTPDPRAPRSRERAAGARRTTVHTVQWYSWTAGSMPACYAWRVNGAQAQEVVQHEGVPRCAGRLMHHGLRLPWRASLSWRVSWRVSLIEAPRRPLRDGLLLELARHVEAWLGACVRLTQCPCSPHCIRALFSLQRMHTACGCCRAACLIWQARASASCMCPPSSAAARSSSPRRTTPTRPPPPTRPPMAACRAPGSSRATRF